MSDELKIAALSLLLDKDNQKPLPQVMQDVALEWLAERDTTPVDAEWLDGVLGPRKRDVMGRDYWEKGGFALHDWHDRSGLRIIVGHSVDIQNPTRGDVLTALRLFGGDNPQ